MDYPPVRNAAPNHAGSYGTLVTVSFWVIFAMQALIVLFATTNGFLGTGRTAERIGFFLFVALCIALVATVCALAMLQRWRLRIPIDDLVSFSRSMFTVQFAAFFTVILALRDDLRFMAYEIFGIPLIVGAVGALMLFFYIPSHHRPLSAPPFTPPPNPYIAAQQHGPMPRAYPTEWIPRPQASPPTPSSPAVPPAFPGSAPQLPWTDPLR